MTVIRPSGTELPARATFASRARRPAAARYGTARDTSGNRRVVANFTLSRGKLEPMSDHPQTPERRRIDPLSRRVTVPSGAEESRNGIGVVLTTDLSTVVEAAKQVGIGVASGVGTYFAVKSIEHKNDPPPPASKSE